MVQRFVYVVQHIEKEEMVSLFIDSEPLPAGAVDSTTYLSDTIYVVRPCTASGLCVMKTCAF